MVEIPLPDSMYLSDAGPTHFTINWNPPTRHCTTDVGYRIHAAGSEHCGNCTNITTTNSRITCSNLSISDQPCNLSIHAGSDVAAIFSDPIQIILASECYMIV